MDSETDPPTDPQPRSIARTGPHAAPRADPPSEAEHGEENQDTSVDEQAREITTADQEEGEEEYDDEFGPLEIEAPLKLEPTYRMESQRPVNREVCENIIKNVVNTTFEDFIYRPKQALYISSDVSEEIKDRVKAQNYDRYKFVCIVTVGEKLMQGYCSLLNFLWDADFDGYVTYTYDMPSFFVIATLYYMYYN